LKEVVNLTKDMLTIRDMEVRDLTERMEAMSVKFQAERDRQSLMQKKMALSDQLNTDLKAEHKAQKDIFNILRDQYKVKLGTLEQQLNEMKANNGETAGPSTSKS
jgi:membrane protease subunit (stomatin/prohibitin family)